MRRLDLIATLALIGEMQRAGESGSVVLLLCDGGERYGETYYNPDWIAEQNLDTVPWTEALACFDRGGVFDMPLESHGPR